MGSITIRSSTSGEKDVAPLTVGFFGDWEMLWTTNWDAGTVLLDMADPTRPVMIGRTGFDPDAEGNAHAAWVDEDAGLLLQSDEDLFPSEGADHRSGWGGLHLYDISDPTAPVERGTVPSPGARDDGVVRNGFYSAHEAEVHNAVAYTAWYSGGVRILGLANPSEPAALASFVPPAVRDPQGYWEAPDGSRAFAMVWGVTPADGLVFAIDMNTGLWILRLTPEAEDAVTLTELGTPAAG